MTQADRLRDFLRAILEMKRYIMNPPKGYNYLGAEDYLLDRGHEYLSAPLTAEERKQVFAAVDNWGKRFKLGECFYNAQVLLFYDQAETLTYCEGYACGPAGMPVLHAWLAINGKVVDLTWRTEEPNHRGRLPDRIIGVIPEGWVYFGFDVPRRTVIERLIDTEMSASFLEDWKAGYPLFKQERIHPVKDLLG